MRKLFLSVTLALIFISCKEQKLESDLTDYSFTNYDYDNKSLVMLFQQNLITIDSFIYQLYNPISFDVYELIEESYWSCDIILSRLSNGSNKDELWDFFSKSINYVISRENLDHNDLKDIISLIKATNPILMSSQDLNWEKYVNEYFENVLLVQQDASNYKLDICEKIILRDYYNSLRNNELSAIYFTADIGSADYERVKRTNYGAYNKEFIKMSYGYNEDQFEISLKHFQLPSRDTNFE